MAGNGWYREDEAITALLQSSSIVEASKLCNVSTRTFTRYLKDKGFQERLKQAKLQLLDGAINKLRNSAAGAVDVLLSIMNDPIMPPQSRVTAAKTIVQFAVECGHVEAIKDRLEELERKTITATPQWSGGEHE